MTQNAETVGHLQRCDIRGCVLVAVLTVRTNDGERVDLCDRHQSITLPQNDGSES